MSLLRRIEQTQEPTDQQAAQSSWDQKWRIRNRLLAELDLFIDVTQPGEARSQLKERYEAILAEENIVLPRVERQRLFEQIAAEILGYGLLEPLLNDPSVTAVMVNGPKNVRVEREGRIERVDARFESDEHVMQIIDRIVAPLGRRIDERSPMVSVRLPDGSRASAVVPPISLSGPLLTIRKFARIPLTLENLIAYGSITPEAVEFLQACIHSRLNILISGNTSSGKTTLLNILSGLIPPAERVVTVENVAELQIRLEHVLALEARPPNLEGRGEVSIQDLVVNCSHLRPDRIIMGRLYPGMYEPMVLATNLCSGFLSTIPAESPRQAISQLEQLALEELPHLPLALIREQIADSIDLIVQQNRMSDGSRRMLTITEVQSRGGKRISLSDIFLFEQTGVEANRVLGCLRLTGTRPDCLGSIENYGIQLPSHLFDPR